MLFGLEQLLVNRREGAKAYGEGSFQFNFSFNLILIIQGRGLAKLSTINYLK